MEEKEQKKGNNLSQGEEIISWQVPEYEEHERGRNWHIAAMGVALLLMIYSFITSNFLFAVIIIIAALVIILHHGKEPDMVDFIVTGEGITIGRKFFDFDEIKNFSIIYKPKQDIKNIYFDFKNPFRLTLSIPLADHDPLKIRKIMLKYLSEDLDMTEPPLSEVLTKIFKL